MTTFGLIAQHPAFAETKLSQTKPASQVCLSTGAGPSLCSASGGIGDAPDIPTLSVLAGETVTITFSLEAAPTADATFNVTTANGTAVATTDYTSYSGSVLCPANQTACTATPPATITFIADMAGKGNAPPLNFLLETSDCVNVCNCSGCNGGPNTQLNIYQTQLKITSGGTELAAGKCAAIDATPTMPNIVTQIVAPHYPAKLPLNVTWNLQVSYTGPDSPPTTYSYNVPNTAVAASTAFTIPWNNTYIGGQSTLTYTYLTPTQQTFKFCINGMNPAVSTVMSALGTSPWYIDDIAYIESGHTYAQFRANGNPVFGAPHGFGIMQLDPPRSQGDLFEWTQNVTDGIAKVDNAASYGLGFWNRQVAQYTAWAQAHNNLPVPPGNDSEGTTCVFSYTPSGGEYPFSDAISIKVYNGAPRNYIFWLNTGAHATNPAWEFSKCSTTSVGTVCYVAEVCSANQ